MHLKIIQSVALAINQTDCLICAQMPTYTSRKIPLIGVPVPVNPSLLSNSKFGIGHESSTWFPNISSSWNNYTILTQITDLGPNSMVCLYGPGNDSLG